MILPPDVSVGSSDVAVSVSEDDSIFCGSLHVVPDPDEVEGPFFEHEQKSTDTARNSNTLNIEAMFIDEGFGSLDSESRELALDVVFDLSNNNRLIGLISHIDDLKNKIQNQINVVKTQNGSKIEINF